MVEIDQIVNNRKALYVRAIEALNGLIESGRLKPGDQLPSEEILASQLGISRSTLREALGHLETHGIISRRQGVGTFITKPFGGGVMGGLSRLETFRSLAKKAQEQPEVIERTVGIVQATAEMANALDINVHAPLIRVQSTEAIDGIRCMYIDDYLNLPGEYEQQLAEYEDSVVTFLLEEFEPPLAHSRSEIFAINADEEIASRLAIPKGQAVLQLSEIYFSSTGLILGSTLAYFLTEHFRFYITRSAVNL